MTFPGVTDKCATLGDMSEGRRRRIKNGVARTAGARPHIVVTFDELQMGWWINTPLECLQKDRSKGLSTKLPRRARDTESQLENPALY